VCRWLVVGKHRGDKTREAIVNCLARNTGASARGSAGKPPGQVKDTSKSYVSYSSPAPSSSGRARRLSIAHGSP